MDFKKFPESNFNAIKWKEFCDKVDQGDFDSLILAEDKAAADFAQEAAIATRDLAPGEELAGELPENVESVDDEASEENLTEEHRAMIERVAKQAVHNTKNYIELRRILDGKQLLREHFKSKHNLERYLAGELQ